MKANYRMPTRMMALVLATLMTVILVPGCSGKSNDVKQTNQATAQTQKADEKADLQKPITIRIGTNFDGLEFPSPDNKVQKAIESYTNTKLEIKAYQGKAWNDMLPTLIASGDMPEILAFSHLWSGVSFMVEPMQQGIFWDIGPYIKDYPNISKIHPVALQDSTIDGKLCGVPRMRPLVRRTFIYRKDWADALNIKEPKTVDDLYNMAKAFTQNDPDKNGKADTYGLLMDKTAVGHFGLLFGAPNGWEIKDGKAIRAAETPEYLEGLKYLKKFYDEKIMHPDFAIIERDQFYNYYAEAKGGIMRDQTSGLASLYSRAKEKNPKADTTGVMLLEGPKGIRTLGETGHNGMLAMAKSTVKTEAQLKRILAFIDKLCEPTMANLFTWGVEGEHYTVKDGKAVPINEKLKDMDDKVKYPYRQTLATLWPETNAMPGVQPDMIALGAKLENEAIKYVVPNPTYAFYSKTAGEKGTSLDQIIDDASVKFIMGKINEEQYKAEIQRWKTGGGDQMGKEYVEAYTKSTKK